jgi:hypothetical protein
MNNNLLSSPMACRLGQSSYDPYSLSRNDDEYLMPLNVAKMTPGCSVRAARLLTATMLYFNSSSELLQIWGQSNTNFNDYYSNRMEIRSTFWLPDITDWWRHQEETHSKYSELSNVAHDIFSIISHGIRMEASLTLG